MNPQPLHDGPTALHLNDTCIFLARDGTVRSYAKTAETLRKSGSDPELTDGRMLAMFHVSSPRDVHYPTWEMHPDGDELLILASGSLSVEVRDGKTICSARLPSQAAFVVPAAQWHRLIVHEPSVLIAITPRRNTVHQNWEDDVRAAD
ncbi:hypothetical protein [Burkholderia sp. 9120]|uniref:hypothetical protein n=1 Tax=Burkholderia sp. 9120 TaxID=1500897 RepID=UPI0006925BC9|nr:hypothetical protein [Burkholderia sp. 9120]